jgi:hypothetical protein
MPTHQCCHHTSHSQQPCRTSCNATHSSSSCSTGGRDTWQEVPNPRSATNLWPNCCYCHHVIKSTVPLCSIHHCLHPVSAQPARHLHPTTKATANKPAVLHKCAAAPSVLGPAAAFQLCHPHLCLWQTAFTWQNAADTMPISGHPDEAAQGMTTRSSPQSK